MFTNIFDDSVINLLMYNDMNAILYEISELRQKFMKEKYRAYMLDAFHVGKKVFYKGFVGSENTYFILNNQRCLDEFISNMEAHQKKNLAIIFITDGRKYQEICELINKILCYTSRTQIKFIIFIYDENKEYGMSSLLIPNFGYLDYNTLMNNELVVLKMPWDDFNNRIYMREADRVFSCDEKEKTKVMYQPKNYIDCRFSTDGEHDIVFQFDIEIYQSYQK